MASTNSQQELTEWFFFNVFWEKTGKFYGNALLVADPPDDNPPQGNISPTSPNKVTLLNSHVILKPFWVQNFIIENREAKQQKKFLFEHCLKGGGEGGSYIN